MSAPDPVLLTDEKAALLFDARAYAECEDCALLELSANLLAGDEVLGGELMVACDDSGNCCDDCALDDDCGLGLFPVPSDAPSDEAPPQALNVNTENTKDSNDKTLNHLYICKYLKFSKPTCPRSKPTYFLAGTMLRGSVTGYIC